MFLNDNNQLLQGVINEFRGIFGGPNVVSTTLSTDLVSFAETVFLRICNVCCETVSSCPLNGVLLLVVIFAMGNAVLFCNCCF